MSEDTQAARKRPATVRADDLLNRVAWTAGLVPSVLWTILAKTAAYAREGAADMWAEAQSIRRRNASAKPHEGAKPSPAKGAVPERNAEATVEEVLEGEATRYPPRTWMQTPGSARTTFGASRTPGYAASSRRT